MTDQARANPPQTDPRFGFIQQQLAAQDRVMSEMAAGIKSIEKLVSESATAAALSAQHRAAMQKELDETKKTVGTHEDRLNRDETIGRAAIIVTSIVLVPILLLIVGGFGTIFFVLLTQGHVP